MNKLRIIVIGDLKHPAFLNLKLSLKDHVLTAIQETTNRMEILLRAISQMDNNDIIIACLGCELLCLRSLDLLVENFQNAFCVKSSDNKTCFIMGRKKDIESQNLPSQQDHSICFKVSRDMELTVNDDLSIWYDNRVHAQPFFVIFDSVNYHSSIPIVSLFRPNSMFGVYDNYSKLGKKVNGSLHVDSMPVDMTSFIPAMWIERAILTLAVFFLLIMIIYMLM